jgi:hypothetical protein
MGLYMTKISTSFDIRDLPGDPRKKSALLISPPVYDVQYWKEWSQPYGLLRIAALLRKHHYRRIEFFDFREVQPKNRIHKHRINVDETYIEIDKPNSPIKPYVITKPGDSSSLKLFKNHFGRTWKEFDEWLESIGFNLNNPPDEIWISAVMTYWWESVRDLIGRLRNLFGKQSLIILGGIYPTLSPHHASEFTKPDIVVAGEVEEANDLWSDLSLYENPPNYAIITPSRGCPFNCAYCAQKTINNGRSHVHFRSTDDIFNEMLNKRETFGIRDFAFYADFLLWRYETNFMPLLQKLAEIKRPFFKLYAPEGFDVNLLSRSQRLVDLIKEAHFQKIYLPCESIDDNFVRTLNRKHVKLEHFVKAAQMCEKAGFELRNLDVNAFVLYGLPGETVDRVVKTILFVSEIVGSIIPMLFTPVPSTRLFQQHLQYIKDRDWDQNLQMLNGKLYPFIEMNEGSISDYVDMQRLMYTLNAHYRSESFRIFGDSKVSITLRDNIHNGFEDFVLSYKSHDFTEEEEINTLNSIDI